MARVFTQSDEHKHDSKKDKEAAKELRNPLSCSPMQNSSGLINTPSSLNPKQTTAYLKGASGHHLNEESINRIVDKILTATPLPVTVKFQQPQHPLRDRATRPPSGHRFGAAQILQGTNQHGRNFVRIRGTQESAKKVWEQYGKPGQLCRDRFDKGVFFFYCD
jgi:hypothetical protein